MNAIKDLSWFKNIIAPTLKKYEISYRFYEKGDFGSLNQVIFNSPEKGGGIDFWGLGWLGIDVYDYKKDQQVLNILLEPEQHVEKEKAFEELLILLNIENDPIDLI